MIRPLVIAALLLVGAPRAEALMRCLSGQGWALPADSTVPVRPHLALYYDKTAASQRPAITATIDGAAVPVALAFVAAGPHEIALITVDSPKTGKLVLTIADAPQEVGHDRIFPEPTVSYTIAKVKLPRSPKAALAIYHAKERHTQQPRETLVVGVEMAAIAFTARWRRDDKQAWQTLEIPSKASGAMQIARLGWDGCANNFETAILDRGIDLQLSALLPDGTRLALDPIPRIDVGALTSALGVP